MKTPWGRRGRVAVGALALLLSAACGAEDVEGQGMTGDFPSELASRLRAEIAAWAEGPTHRGVSAAVLLPSPRR